MALALMLGGLAGGASAALHDRGNGLIYDDVLDITWTQNASLPGSSGLTWSQANTWAADLVFGGYDDWRLPTTPNRDGTGLCFQLGCSGSEMGHMFYNNLGGSGFVDKTGDQTTAGGVTLNNIQRLHWSETAFNSLSSFVFIFDNGDQTISVKNAEFGAWAVRQGDVTAVPEPASLLLVAAGMLGLGWSRRRGRRR